MMKALRTRLRADDGISAVLVALLIVFLIIPVSAVSIDLSNAFSNRRQMQNAADAAAQAGAQEMNLVRLKMIMSGFGSDLDAKVQQVAKANGADTSSSNYSCTVVDVSYSGGVASVQPSPQTPCANWTGDVTSYNAVRVHAFHTVKTFLAGAMFGGGNSSTSAGATATATVQKVVNPPGLGLATFAVCANAYTNKQKIDPAMTPLLVADPSSPVPNSNPQQYYYKLNVAAEGVNYSVWSNGGGSSNVSDCQFNSQNFNGLICGMYQPATDPTNKCAQPISLPQNPPSGASLSITNGAVVGPTLATFAGFPACNPADFGGTSVGFQGCAMALPICDYGSNPSGSVPALLHCITMGLFYLTPGTQRSSDATGDCDQTPGVKQDTICGKFIGPATDPLGGTPSTGDPQPGDSVRIALVQ